MDPRAMEIAMEQMKKMSPAQMQAMMSNVQMNPAMMQQAMAQMKNMKGEDWERAKQQMSGLSADEIARQAAQMNTHMAAQQQYVFNASTQLKNEGNRLHGLGQYSEAVEKYSKARSNMEGHSGKEVEDLVKACTLNLSSCFLNLKQYEKCIAECETVLAGEPESIKALYRRGQAYMGVSRWQAAVRDLDRAAKLSSSDPPQQKMIREKLQEAKDRVSALRASGQLKEEEEEQAPPAASTSTSSSAPATSTPAPAATSSSSTASASASAPATAGLGPSLDPEMMRSAAEMMKQNPDWAKQMCEQMGNMSEEQLEAMGRMTGMPMNRDMLRTMQEQMSKLDPAQLEAMAKMQAAMPAQMREKLASGRPEDRAAALAAAQDPKTLEQTAKMMAENPEMAKMAADMLANMPPEQLEEMSKQGVLPAGMQFTPEMARMAAESLKNLGPQELQELTKAASSMQMPAGFGAGAAAGSSGSGGAPGGASTSGSGAAASMPAMPGAPGGMQLTPEMAKMAADMMANMKPEDMAAMQKMAMGMGMGGHGGMAGMDPSSLSGMSAAMKNPAMMESAMAMMKNMDEDSLANMLMSSGMCRNPDQAKTMAKQVKGMSDTQMRMMMKTASVVQGVGQAAARTKEVLLSSRTLVVALAVILLAVLLRYLGIM